MRDIRSIKTFVAASLVLALSLFAAQTAHAVLPKPTEDPFVKENKDIATAATAINAELSGGKNKQKVDALKARLDETLAKKKERLESLKKEFDKEIDKLKDKIAKSKGSSNDKLEKDKAALEKQKLDLDTWYVDKKPDGVPDPTQTKPATVPVKDPKTTDQKK